MNLQFVTKTPEGEELKRLFQVMVPKSPSHNDTMEALEERINERITQKSVAYNMENMDFVCFLEKEDRVYNCTIYGKVHIAEEEKNVVQKKEKTECFYSVIASFDNVYEPNFAYNGKALDEISDSIYTFVQSSRRATLLKKINIPYKDRDAAITKIDEELSQLYSEYKLRNIASVSLSDDTVGFFYIKEPYVKRYSELVIGKKALKDWEKCIALPSDSPELQSKLLQQKIELTGQMDKALATKNVKSGTAIQKKLLTLKEFILD